MKTVFYLLIIFATIFTSCSIFKNNSLEGKKIVYINLFEIDESYLHKKGYLYRYGNLECPSYSEEFYCELIILNPKGAAFGNIYRRNDKTRLLSFSYSDAKEVKTRGVVIKDYVRGEQVVKEKYLVPKFNYDMKYYTSDSLIIKKIFRKCILGLPKE